MPGTPEGGSPPPLTLTMNERISLRHVLNETIERLVSLRNALEPTGKLSIHREALAVDFERLTVPLVHERDQNYRKIRAARGRESGPDQRLARAEELGLWPTALLRDAAERLQHACAEDPNLRLLAENGLVRDFLHSLRQMESYCAEQEKGRR